MNETDTPLKRLVHTSIVDFAEWLLKSEVESVRTANIELPADPDPIKADQLFWVTLVDGTEILFHIEFQGRSSHKPMRFRMLDYSARLTDVARKVRIHSVIFYIGEGVGAQDTGRHQIYGVGDRVTLAWHYDVVHLWKLTPEELLALGRPGLLPLIGQTKLEKPDEVFPQVFEQIKGVAHEETKHRLLIELLALVTDERIIEMVENFIEQEEWVLDTPFLRRMRRQAEEARNEGIEEGIEKGREKGLEEGIEKGLEEGIEKGREEGLEEGIEKGREEGIKTGLEKGILQTRSQSILDLLLLRHDPSANDYLQVQNKLSNIWSDETLKNLFRTAAIADDFSTFVQTLEELTSSSDMGQLQSA